MGIEDNEAKNFSDEMCLLWKKFLLNQFHDVIPGSCIEQVAIDALALYQGEYSGKVICYLLFKSIVLSEIRTKLQEMFGKHFKEVVKKVFR